MGVTISCGTWKERTKTVCQHAQSKWSHCMKQHPIPIIDEILEDMRGATAFSKLDLKWGCLQIDLKPESKKIRTFVTHTGLWCDKRLIFRISSAPEIYQHIVRRGTAGVTLCQEKPQHSTAQWENSSGSSETPRETADSEQQKLSIPAEKTGIYGSCAGIGAAQSMFEAVENIQDSLKEIRV